MDLIESPRLQINSTAEQVYNFLNDCTQHRLIMPMQVENFVASTNECSYTIKGTGNLSLKLDENIPFSQIKLVPNGKVPFPFSFYWMIESNGDECFVQNKIEAQMNPFIRAIAFNPLRNFISEQNQKLQLYFNR